MACDASYSTIMRARAMALPRRTGSASGRAARKASTMGLMSKVSVFNPSASATAAASSRLAWLLVR